MDRQNIIEGCFIVVFINSSYKGSIAKIGIHQHIILCKINLINILNNVLKKAFEVVFSVF